MKNFVNLFQKIEVHHLKIVFALIIIFKFILLLFVLDGSIQIYKTETDADYYDWFALGISDVGYSIWSFILKDLNEYDFYNRTVIRVLIFGITTLVTPFVFASLLPYVTAFHNLKKYYKTYWCTAIYICLYPTLNFYALDVFRDAVMVFLIGLTFHAVKVCDARTSWARYIWLLPISALFYLVFLFRPYLAGALVVAFVIWHTSIYKVNKILLAGLYLFALLFARYMHWLDPLLNYRASFEYFSGSALGLSLLGDNPFQFILNYGLSIAYQMFGLYINSLALVILFISESFLIIIALTYIYKKKMYMTKFQEYMLLFAVIYAAIWTFINDNMGTAIRLRMFDYITIVVVAASLYIRQLNAQTLTEAKL